ncbi:MAG TPA: DUF6445 family protein [Candidatus Angelobacter sp.]|nr:DUF6445 family protein [Candidatus Angelobacter sp.]
MFKSLIIVDDVYDDPEGMREAALRVDYPTPAVGANYAGRNSSRKLLLPDTDKMLSWVAGEQLVGAGERAHGALRLTLAGDTGRYSVHVDIGVDWSGVLYLNRPEQCRGGTSFFRHRSTGSEHAPTTAEDLVRCNAKTAQEALDRILGRDSNDPAQWEATLTVPMQFNRLVLFRPLLWHSAGDGFGDSTGSGRIVQLFFLRSTSKNDAPPRRA